MVRLATSIITLVNTLLLCIGVALLVFKPFGNCYSLIYVPLTVVGAIFVLLAILGLLGISCRSPFLVWLHLVLYFGFIVVFSFLVFFELAVMTKGAIKMEIAGGEHATHRLQEFSCWLQDHIVGGTEWPQFRTCLIYHHMCDPSNRFYTHLQKGCCKPPPSCGLNQNNGTSVDDPDCRAWSDDNTVMCYYCQSCKAGFLVQFTSLWKRVFPAIVAALIVLILVFMVGCQSLRHLRAYNSQIHCNGGKP